MFTYYYFFLFFLEELKNVVMHIFQIDEQKYRVFFFHSDVLGVFCVHWLTCVLIVVLLSIINTFPVTNDWVRHVLARFSAD